MKRLTGPLPSTTKCNKPHEKGRLERMDGRVAYHIGGKRIGVFALQFLAFEVTCERAFASLVIL